MGVAEQAWSAAQTPCGRRSSEELRQLRCFVLGASRGQLVHSAPSGRGTLFWNFEEAIQDDACQHLALRSPSLGESIFQEGSKAEEVVIVLSGTVDLQLLRDEEDLGLQTTRPKAPIDEVVALEQISVPRRALGCDYVLEEKTMSTVAAVATNHRTTLRLLRGRTEQMLPRIGTPESPVSPTRAPVVAISKPVPASPRVVSPRRALRRGDRLLRPVAEVIQALAAASGASVSGDPSTTRKTGATFQRQWQTFQEQVRSRVDGRRAAAPPTQRRLSAQPGGLAIAGVAEAEEAPEVTVVVANNEGTEHHPMTAQRRPKKVVVLKEKCSSGSILGAAACMAGGHHKWTALAGENCQLLVMSSNFLGRAIKKELKRRRSERQQMLLNALGGPLKMLEEEKLQNLAIVAKTILYRRNEVLCHEGEMRAATANQNRLLVLMLGEARCLRSEEKVQRAASSSRGRWTPASLPSRGIGGGTLLPGHAVNAASILADEPEPFTVMVESLEALVLSLPLSDLARVMSAPLMEKLKAKAMERLTWRRNQLPCAAPGPAADTGATALPSSRSAAPPKKELVRLDPVLHDRPEIVCQSPRQPPGMISFEEGTIPMTSSLSGWRRPPDNSESSGRRPPVPQLKDRPKPHIPAMTARADAPAVEFLAETALSFSSDDMSSELMRSCDDWGLRRLPAMFKKQQSLRRARSMKGPEKSSRLEEDEEAGSGVTMSMSLSEGRGAAGARQFQGKRVATGGALLKRLVEQESRPDKRPAACPPLAPSKGPEDLHVASIEQFLQKGRDSWRGSGKFGRPRTLAKLELDEPLTPVLPTV